VFSAGQPLPGKRSLGKCVFPAEHRPSLARKALSTRKPPPEYRYQNAISRESGIPLPDGGNDGSSIACCPRFREQYPLEWGSHSTGKEIEIFETISQRLGPRAI
jgi:hypothetical protein